MKPKIVRDKKKAEFVPFALSLRFETMEQAVALRNALGGLSGREGVATYDIFDVLDDEVLAQGGPGCPE